MATENRKATARMSRLRFQEMANGSTQAQQTQTPPNAANASFLFTPRRKSDRISDSLRQFTAGTTDDGKSGADLLAARLMDIGLHGRPDHSMIAIREIADRTEGKAVQAVKIEQQYSAQDLQAITVLLDRLLPKPALPEHSDDVVG